MPKTVLKLNIHLVLALRHSSRLNRAHPQVSSPSSVLLLCWSLMNSSI